jgi:hypothetical protein
MSAVLSLCWDFSFKRTRCLPRNSTLRLDGSWLRSMREKVD